MSDAAELVVEYQPEQVAAPGEAATAAHYDKVGGWLLFLCVSLTILNPLTLIAFGAYNFISMAPVFDRFPVLAITSIVDAVLTVLVAGFSLYAGMSLWARRSGSVRLVRVFMLVGAAFTVLTPLLPLAAGLGSEFNRVVLESALQSWRGVFYFALWSTYLQRSKRVKETAGLQESPA